MKKFTLFVAALFIAGAANAQDMTSKRGVNILPEAGDISISMSANPFLNYVGGIMSNTGSNSGNAAVQFLNGWNLIQGRYFLDETKAIRAGLRIGFNSTSTDNKVLGGTNGTTVYTETDNTSSNNIWLTGGLEFRRGNYGRFQGYYGAELVVGFGGSNNTNETIVDEDPVTPNVQATNGYKRTVETRAGSTLNLGLQGFIGVEYFLAPKVALGGEFSWGFLLTTTGEGEVTTSNTTPNTPTTTTKTGRSSEFKIDTGTGFTNYGVAGGNLKLSFFF
jgi:hypothetical protein